jgi:hypothetical protein
VAKWKSNGPRDHEAQSDGDVDRSGGGDRNTFQEWERVLSCAFEDVNGKASEH